MEKVGVDDLVKYVDVQLAGSESSSKTLNMRVNVQTGGCVWNVSSYGKVTGIYSDLVDAIEKYNEIGPIPSSDTALYFDTMHQRYY